MKNFYLIFFAVVSTFFFSDTLSALSIGREGDPYFENGIDWQKVCYKNENSGFEAVLPGSPSSGLSGKDVFTHSNYLDVDYEIHCSYATSFIVPKTAKLFLQKIEEVFGHEAMVITLPSNQKKVKYIAEIYYNEENKVVRVFCSKNWLYWAIVQGEDLSLAPLFFESIKISK